MSNTPGRVQYVFTEFKRRKEKKVTELILTKLKEEIGVELDPQKIDITHRVGKKTQDRSRGILVRFVSHKSKVDIMKKKKHAKNIRISEDLSAGTRKMLNEIYARKDGFGVEKAWTLDGKVRYLMSDSERVLEIRSVEDYSKLMNRAMDH